MHTTPNQASFLVTRRGKLTLALICLAGFLDFIDTTIVNVALPSIRQHLGFSEQSLQWVVSGYLLTYGGFLLLGGRAADLLGRRRLLIAGTSLFGLSSLVGGLSGSEGMLIAARLTQGLGAAMMTPAALSILTTSFTEGTDRVRRSASGAPRSRSPPQSACSPADCSRRAQAGVGCSS
jgi:MFS family permease